MIDFRAFLASRPLPWRGAPGPSRPTEFSEAAQAQGILMRQLLLDFIRAPEPTFENFISGRNAELLAVLDAGIKGQLRERVVYIWGESGAGKSHLLKAFVHAGGPRHARFGRADELTAESMTGVLALDDVDRLPEARQIELFNAFNDHAFSFLAVSAAASPRDVSLRRDLASRLATGLTYRVLALNDAEKRDALAAHAAARGLALTEEVSSYLLTHARRDMPSLIAVLDELDRYSLETGRPITVPLIKVALQPSLLPGEGT